MCECSVINIKPKPELSLNLFSAEEKCSVGQSRRERERQRQRQRERERSLKQFCFIDYQNSGPLKACLKILLLDQRSHHNFTQRVVGHWTGSRGKWPQKQPFRAQEAIGQCSQAHGVALGAVLCSNRVGLQ